MNKFEIEIPGVPQGWTPVAYRPVKPGEEYISHTGGVEQFPTGSMASYLVVEKIKPKRIVLECTGEVRRPEVGEYVRHHGSFCLSRPPGGWWDGVYEIWREVKEEE